MYFSSLKCWLNVVFDELDLAIEYHLCRTNSTWTWKDSIYRYRTYTLYPSIRFSKSIHLKEIAWQSGIGQKPKQQIFTVLWEIIVAPFLKETGQNSWASERFFNALLNETSGKYFLPTMWKIWAFKATRVKTKNQQQPPQL